MVLLDRGRRDRLFVPDKSRRMCGGISIQIVEKRKRKFGTVSDLLRVSFRWTRGSHGSHKNDRNDWELACITTPDPSNPVDLGGARCFLLEEETPNTYEKPRI